jgi:hypothetical protein
MRTITQIYESILDKRTKRMAPKEEEYSTKYEGSLEHKEHMMNAIIEIAKIGQKVKMGRAMDYDGDRLIAIAKDIQKEYD